MTYKQAEKLKQGDKVKQKMHGYVMTVERIEFPFVAGKIVSVYCKMENGEIMRHTHKEIDLIKE